MPLWTGITPETGGSGSRGPDAGAAARAVPEGDNDGSAVGELLVTRGKL